MNDLEDVYKAVLRGDLLSFMQRGLRCARAGYPVLSELALRASLLGLSRVMRGEVRSLIINVPPRSGKSILTTVVWPMFVLGSDPSRRFICVSRTEDPARKFSVDRRIVAQSVWYPAHWAPRSAQ